MGFNPLALGDRAPVGIRCDGVAGAARERLGFIEEQCQWIVAGKAGGTLQRLGSANRDAFDRRVVQRGALAHEVVIARNAGPRKAESERCARRAHAGDEVGFGVVGIPKRPRFAEGPSGGVLSAANGAQRGGAAGHHREIRLEFVALGVVDVVARGNNEIEWSIRSARAWVLANALNMGAQRPQGERVVWPMHM